MVAGKSGGWCRWWHCRRCWGSLRVVVLCPSGAWHHVGGKSGLGKVGRRARNRACGGHGCAVASPAPSSGSRCVPIPVQPVSPLALPRSALCFWALLGETMAMVTMKTITMTAIAVTSGPIHSLVHQSVGRSVGWLVRCPLSSERRPQIRRGDLLNFKHIGQRRKRNKDSLSKGE